MTDQVNPNEHELLKRYQEMIEIFNKAQNQTATTSSKDETEEVNKEIEETFPRLENKNFEFKYFVDSYTDPYDKIKNELKSIHEEIALFKELFSFQVQAIPHREENQDMSAQEFQDLRNDIGSVRERLIKLETLTDEMNKKLDNMPTKSEMTEIILNASKTLKLATEDHVGKVVQETKTEVEGVKTTIQKTHTRIMQWSIGTGLAVIVALWRMLKP